MPKKPDVFTPASPSIPEGAIVTVHGGEAGLPPGLTLSGPMQALRRPNGTLRLLGLPPDLNARFYPGDYVASITLTPPPDAAPAALAQASSPQE